MAPSRGVAPLLLLVSVTVAACATSDRPAPDPVTLPGVTPTSPCERAVAARAEFLRDQGVAGSEGLESEIFHTCTYAEFRAANALMVDRYRYPGEGRAYVGRNCVRLFSLYRGSRLCRSR